MNLKFATIDQLLKEEQRRRMRKQTLRALAFAERASETTVDEAEASHSETMDELIERGWQWNGQEWEYDDIPF